MRRGLPWRGHTELLAHRTGRVVAMMFYADALRVVLATVHSRWRRCRTLTRSGSRGRSSFRPPSCRVSGSAPQLAVAGLNPHAGEHGLFGGEEDG